jgi:hypothetical protein
MPSIRPRHLRLARSAALALTVVLALTAAWTARHPDRPAQPREPAAPARQPAVPRPAPAVEAPAAVPAAAWRPVDEEPHHARPLQAPRPTADGVTLDRVAGDWVSWALLDRRTGNLTTGGDGGTNSTESMIKAWIAADYLRGLGGREPTAGEIDLLRRMIRDSDDDAAETLYQRRGGDPVIGRLISTCGLTDTSVRTGWWSLTRMPAQDAARMGDCIADGRAVSGKWAGWLLSEMRHVRGEGRFGIVDVRPGVAIKNGWTSWGGAWHVNCLAVADGWALAVLIRYPSGLGLGHGAEACRAVARKLAP